MNEIESCNTFSTANQVQAGVPISDDITTSSNVDAYTLLSHGASMIELQFSKSIEVDY
jgi:hypothetical protein